MHIQIFVTNILRLLEEQDITRQELSKRAGIANGFLSDLLRGKANPSLRIMESISNALAVPLPYLLESSDLAREQLLELQGNDTRRRVDLPPGFERVSAVLPEFQAFQVKQWSESGAKTLAKAWSTMKRERKTRL